MKVIALDIETANLDMEAEGLKFDDPQGWKTAVVCVHVAPYHSVADPMDFIYVADNVLEEVRSKCPITMNQRIHPFSKFKLYKSPSVSIFSHIPPLNRSWLINYGKDNIYSGSKSLMILS